jgi:hypothetical protein
VLADGRYTVFVPSVPTPLAGAVYVLAADRVHPVDVPFTQAIRTISRWGSGASDLVAAMRVAAPADGSPPISAAPGSATATPAFLRGDSSRGWLRSETQQQPK